MLDGMGLALLFGAIGARVLFPSEDAASGSGIGVLGFELAAIPLAALILARFPERLTQVSRPRMLWVAALGLLAGWWLVALWPRDSGATSAPMEKTSWLAIGADYRFPAVIMAWEWTGVVAVWLLARALRPRYGAYPLAVGVVALAAAQATAALWQVAVDFPAKRHAFERKTPEFTQQMLEIGIRPGTPEHQSFRDRLYSNDAIGTFGLSNSVAGLFLLGFPLTFALAASLPVRGALGALTTTGLLLTRSRSAWLSALLFPLLGMKQDWRRHWRGLVLAGLGLGALIGLLSVVGVLDRLVIFEAPKSLAYRWEWWRASGRVWAEKPFFGVGPGNFASAYLAYKLPFSSEEIQDPHNFVLEVLCTGGVWNLAAYVAWLGTSLWGLSAGRQPDDSTRQQRTVATMPWPIGVGAALAVILAAGRIDGRLALVALTSLAASLVFLWRSCSFTADPNAVDKAIGAGAIALHVHWLAAGGVAYPGLMLPLWGLLGAAGPPGSAPLKEAPGGRAGLLLAALAGLGMVALFWIYCGKPYQQFEQLSLAARNERGESQRRMLEQAARAVPGDTLGWQRLAAWHLGRFRESSGASSAEHARAAEEALVRVTILDPRASWHQWQLGLLWEEVARREFDAGGIQRAIAAFEEALRRYPNSARRNYHLGEVLWKAGRSDQAAAAFERALYLDQTPHPDKKLTEEERRVAQRLVQRLRAGR